MKLLNIKPINNSKKPKGYYVPSKKVAELTYGFSHDSAHSQNVKSFGFLRKFKLNIKALFFGACLVFVFYAVHFLIFKTDYFTVTKVEVTGAEKYVSKTDVENMLKNKVIGKNILTLNTQESEKILSKNFLGIKNLTISKKIFHEVICDITERKPAIIFVSESQKLRYLVDEEGYVLGLAEDSYTNLPDVSVPENIEIGKFAPKSYIPVVMDLLTSSKTERLNVTSISIKNDYSQFMIDGTVLVKLLLRKDTKESVKIISKVISQPNDLGQNATQIDLRSDKVIVSYH